MHQKIKNDIKEAMKAKDIEKRDCLKNVLGKAQEEWKKDNPTAASDVIDDDVMMKAVQKEVKQLEQTLDYLKGCKEAELYITSEIQLNILKAYLPKQMDQKEVEEAVAWILSKEDPVDFGKRMKLCMKELRDKADSKLIRKVVENYK